MNHFPHVKSDIYVDTGNRISTNLLLQIYNTNIFENIYINNNLVTLDAQFKNRKSVWHAFTNKSAMLLAWELYLFPKWIQLQKTIDCSENHTKYERIFVGTFGESAPIIIKEILKIHPQTPISIVEEGLACYHRSIAVFCLDYVNFNKLSPPYLRGKLFGINKSFCLTIAKNVDSIYLYNPTSYTQIELVNLVKLPPITENNETYALFSSELDEQYLNIYNQRSWCYLLQDTSPKLDKLISLYIKHIGHGTGIIREHPWHSVFNNLKLDIDFQDVYIDESAACMSFESLCSQIKMDKFVLITTDSSSTFTPKYMHDKEPYIIYLYHITENRSKDFITTNDKIVESLRNTYVRKDRIYVPKSMREYEDCLNTISKLISK